MYIHVSVQYHMAVSGNLNAKSKVDLVMSDIFYKSLMLL